MIQPGFNQYDPMFVVVDAVTGGVLDLNKHPVTRADGSRASDAILYDVFGRTESQLRAHGGGQWLRCNTLSYVTVQFVPPTDLTFCRCL